MKQTECCKASVTVHKIFSNDKGRWFDVEAGLDWVSVTGLRRDEPDIIPANTFALLNDSGTYYTFVAYDPSKGMPEEFKGRKVVWASAIK